MKKNWRKKTNQRQKETISTEMLNKQTAVKNNRTKRRNRRTQQTQSRRPPDNDKMIDRRRKPTKTRAKRAELKRKKKGFKKKKAGSYLLSHEEQYHRRKRAWLPCSEWERVLPLHCGHRHFMPCCSASIRSGTAMCPGPDVRFRP